MTALSSNTDDKASVEEGVGSSTTTKSYTTYPCITQEIIDKYDGFILDQFGVLHNGHTGLDGAPECVEALTKLGKKCIILSNSSSASNTTVAKLPKLGFNPKHFIGAVTSGEEASLYIREHYSNKKALFLTWKDKKDNNGNIISSPGNLFLEKCNNSITVTDNIDDADFILLHGVEVLRTSEGGENVHILGSFHQDGVMTTELKNLLQRCADTKEKGKQLPMVCCNPDFIMVKPDNTKAYMPGMIEKYYVEECNGNCTSFGKPYVEHFDACVRDLQLPKNKIVHVGDSLHHDIQGANECGIDSIFVVGGIHRKDFTNCSLGSLPSKIEELDELFDKYKQIPTHVVPMFKM